MRERGQIMGLSTDWKLKIKGKCRSEELEFNELPKVMEMPNFTESRLREDLLPIIWDQSTFEKFVKGFEKLYPEDEYPDFEIKYRILPDGRMVIVGFGLIKDVVRQSSALLKNNPELRKQKWQLRALRNSRKLLLR